MGVVDRVRLLGRNGIGVMRLWLCGRWQWVVGQAVGVGVSALYGAQLISRWFMMRLVVLVVEAAVPFYRTTTTACVSPARWGVMTLTGCGVVGHWDSSRGRALSLERLWGKVPRNWGWGSALQPPRRRGRGFTDYRGVRDMGSGGGRRLRQLSTASTWRTGPRGRRDRTSAD